MLPSTSRRAPPPRQTGCTGRGALLARQLLRLALPRLVALLLLLNLLAQLGSLPLLARTRLREVGLVVAPALRRRTRSKRQRARRCTRVQEGGKGTWEARCADGRGAVGDRTWHVPSHADRLRATQWLGQHQRMERSGSHARGPERRRDSAFGSCCRSRWRRRRRRRRWRQLSRCGAQASGKTLGGEVVGGRWWQKTSRLGSSATRLCCLAMEVTAPSSPPALHQRHGAAVEAARALAERATRLCSPGSWRWPPSSPTCTSANARTKKIPPRWVAEISVGWRSEVHFDTRDQYLSAVAEGRTPAPKQCATLGSLSGHACLAAPQSTTATSTTEEEQPISCATLSMQTRKRPCSMPRPPPSLLHWFRFACFDLCRCFLSCFVCSFYRSESQNDGLALSRQARPGGPRSLISQPVL